MTTRKRDAVLCADCGCCLTIRRDQLKEVNRCRSCAAINKWVNKSYREHQSEVHTGKVFTNECKDKISQALKGKIPTNLVSLHEARTKKFGVAAMNSYYKSYKNQAKKRSKLFELSLSDFKSIVTGDCIYCGAAPSVVKRPHPAINGHVIVNGVDRIDNNIGYTASNCAPCCKICNYAKQQMTVTEFVAWVNRVSEHMNSEGWNAVSSREILTK